MGSPRTLAELRAMAAEHDEQIASVHWFTASELAARWRVSLQTIYDTPREQLRFKEFGQGEKLKRRRYRADWIADYEESREHAA